MRDSPTPEQADATDSQPSDGDSEKTREPRQGLKLRQVISSIFAAGLGVQSSKNRERDFSQGSIGTFIAAGLIFTTLFIGGVYLVVQIVLDRAT